MPVAIQVQERRRLASRTIASIAAVLVVLTGVLALRHAAEVRHVRDPYSGDYVHAQALAERHEHGTTSHVHGRAAQHDDDAAAPCTLIGVVHGAVATCADAAHRADGHAMPAIAAPSSDVVPAIAAYRLAPKTSPPARG